MQTDIYESMAAGVSQAVVLCCFMNQAYQGVNLIGMAFHFCALFNVVPNYFLLIADSENCGLI
eukprot:SAG31_NODE_1675_length_7552_cov_69.287228_10_plen_63_part_00